MLVRVVTALAKDSDLRLTETPETLGRTIFLCESQFWHVISRHTAEETVTFVQIKERIFPNHPASVSQKTKRESMFNLWIDYYLYERESARSEIPQLR